MVRLYIPHLDACPLTLDKDQAHYLKNVLRLNEGDVIQVFNETGEWLAQINDLKKNQASIILSKQLRHPEPMTSLGLAFAPLKHDAQSFLLEKATELGVTDLYPVLAQRSNIHKISQEKWLKNAIEASQQCERLAPPIIHPLQSLDMFLKNIADSKTIIMAKERGDAMPIAQALRAPLTKPCVFLIGPEGGFTPQEFALVAKAPHGQFIHLGPRILRAETAALATLTCFQSLLGDWQR